MARQLGSLKTMVLMVRIAVRRRGRREVERRIIIRMDSRRRAGMVAGITGCMVLRRLQLRVPTVHLRLMVGTVGTAVKVKAKATKPRRILAIKADTHQPMDPCITEIEAGTTITREDEDGDGKRREPGFTSNGTAFVV